MPLSQNVSGTLKKITKLTQNVSGTLKPLTSLKQNVSGTLKEVFSWSSLPTDINMLTTYTALAATLSGTAYSNSSGSADTNSATISVNTSNYKYLKVSIKTTSYIDTTCSLIIVFNTALLDNPVVEIDLTGAATTHTKTITLSSSSIANKTLTSCTMALYFKNSSSTTMSISATPTEFKFYN